MNISRTSQGLSANRFKTTSPSTPSGTETQAKEPQDLNDFKTDAVTIGGLSLFGGAVGAVPGLGAFSYAPASNEKDASLLTKAAAMGGFVANLVGTAVVLNGGPAWAMAVPGVLGAVTWGSLAYETRNHC